MRRGFLGRRGARFLVVLLVVICRLVLAEKTNQGDFDHVARLGFLMILMRSR